MLLSFRDMTVSYGGESALRDFSLDMAEGDIVALVGESGSGKTTAIRAVMGLLPGNGEVTCGDILFEDRSLLSLTGAEWRALRGEKIAMIFQDSGAMLNPIRTIGSQFVEYVTAHRKMSRNEADALAEDMLSRTGLPHVKTLMKTYPFQISGGQRQRVGIALAMTFRPRLLLADEPTSALDVTTQAQIVRQMMELRESGSTSILIVTHNLGVAAYMADRIFVMKDGRVVESGGRDEIIRHAKDEYTRRLLEAVPELKGERYV